MINMSQRILIVHIRVGYKTLFEKYDHPITMHLMIPKSIAFYLKEFQTSRGFLWISHDQTF